MTYQPYPAAGGSNQMPVADRPPQPPSLRNAVRLMWAGAALALLSVIISVAFSGKIKTAVTNAALKANATNRTNGKTVLTASQIHTLANVTVVVLVIAGLIGVLLWVWMAWANNRGSGWARIIASVLFALITVEVVLARSRSSVSFLVILLEWVIGLVTIVLLWQRETTAYIGPA